MMKKNVKYLLTVLFTVALLSVFCVQGFAADGKLYTAENGGKIWYTQSGDEITITGIVGADANETFVIPETINGCTVTAIAGRATDAKLSEIIFPRTLKSIGSDAFSRCDAKRVIFNDLEDCTIGDNLFSNSKDLKTVIFGNMKNCTIGKGFNTDMFFKGSSIETLSFGNLENCVFAQSAFENCTTLTSVTFGTAKNVQFNNRAFAKTGLTKVTLPEGTVFGQELFCDCTKLEKAVIKGEPFLQTDDWHREFYSEGMFKNCENLREVTLSPAFAKIYGEMFYNCKSLETFDFSNVTTVAQKAFAGCASLNNIDLSNVETVEKQGFAGCSSIEQISLNSMQFIGTRAFKDCTAIKELYFGRTFTVLDGAFEDCTGIKRFIIGDDVSVIRLDENEGPYTDFLSGCTGIEYIYIGKSFLPWQTADGVTFINAESFLVSNHAFESLKTIAVSPENPWYFTDNDGVLYLDDEKAIILLCYPQAKTDAFYSAKDVLKDYDKPFTIGFAAFCCTKNLKEVEFTKPLTFMDGSVEENVWYMDFNRCFMTSSVEKLTFPKGGLTFVGWHMFSGSQIRDIDLSKVEKIASYGFEKCDNLLHVDLPACNSLGYRVFGECQNLETVNLPALYAKYDSWSNIENFSEQVFYGCPALHTVNMPNVGVIPDATFYGCTALKNVNAPKCAYVEAYAFTNCTALQTVDMPIVFIGKYAFKNCSSLKNVNVKSSIAKVCQYAFENCTALESINLKSVTFIESYAFKGCTALKNVRMYAPQRIYDSAFQDCTELTLVQFNGEKCKIDTNAFRNCPKISFYCEEGSDAYNYAVEKKIPVVAISVKFHQDAFEYTGTEIQPSIIVSIGGMALVQNKDYTLTFHNNKGVGTATVIIHFIGDFEDLPDAERLFSIKQRSILDATVEYVKDYIYSGGNIEPVVVITLDGKTLVEGVDYIINYSSTADTGTMRFTVTGRGCYGGKLECYYNIIRCDIENTAATVVPDMVYNGSALFPKPTLMWNGFTLIEGVDYEIRYFDNVNSGHGVMMIYGLGNFCGTKRVTFRIFGQSLTTAEVSEIPDVLYTGNELTPDVTVTLDGKILQKDVDYTVRYENNTEKGTATVIISGIGNYSGVITQNFSIVKNSVYGFTVFSETEMTATYNGTPLKPEMEVYFGTERLTEGVDYTVTLTNNTNAGTATVTVTGIGRFEGERSYDFTILPCEITEDDITVSGSTEFNGEAVEPQIAVTKNGAILQNGVDYAVEYRNNNGVGTAYVTVKGLGNYCNTVNMEYEIYITDPNNGDEPSETPENPDSSTNPNQPDSGNSKTPTNSENPKNPATPATETGDKTDTAVVEIPKTGRENNGASAVLWFAAALFVLLAVSAADDTRRKAKNRK